MKLTLISCNIRFSNPADGLHAWENRRDFLVSTLLQHSPDVISTQEGRYDQLKDLESRLKDYILIDEHRSWIKERMYPSIFLKKSKFEIIKSEDLWLSETPDVAGSLSFESTFPRLLTWTKIQPKNSTTNLMIVNTHLDHVRTETRLGQIRVLTQEIKRVWRDECLLAVMGDFNDGPESLVRLELIENFPCLKDAWRNFHQVEQTSHHAFKGEIQNGSRIDWIMLQDKIEILSCDMDKSVQNGIYPTDHFPIVCQIKL